MAKDTLTKALGEYAYQGFFLTRDKKAITLHLKEVPMGTFYMQDKHPTTQEIRAACRYLLHKFNTGLLTVV